MVRLFYRVAGTGQVVGAPFQAERFGQNAPCLVELARHRVVAPDAAAYFLILHIGNASAMIGGRHAIGCLVNEGGNARILDDFREIE